MRAHRQTACVVICLNRLVTLDATRIGDAPGAGAADEAI